MKIYKFEYGIDVDDEDRNYEYQSFICNGWMLWGREEGGPKITRPVEIDKEVWLLHI